MGKEIEGKVIKPPMETISSGKMFRPDTAFIYKGWLTAILVLFIIWALLMLAWLGIAYMVIVLDEMLTVAQFWEYFNSWWPIINMVYWAVNIIWLIPGFILWAVYVRSIRYSVIAETGETMHEIYVRKGIVTVTEKHVPFRTITNISSKAGPLDRLFGIGSVEIQTAGYSGGTQAGAKPEEKLEGICIFESVRDFILRELRKFRDPYVVGTEVVTPRESQPEGKGDVEYEMLSVLKEIRDILKKS